MPLVQEDGSGLSTANTFVLETDVDAYATDRGDTYGWVALSSAQKTAAIVKAADYLRNETRYLYRGQRATAAQRLPWPRTGAAEIRGPAIPSNTVPWRMLDAQCELAMRWSVAGADLQPTLVRGGKTATETVDSLTTAYQPDAPGEDLILAVQGLLQPILRTRPEDVAFPTVVVAAAEPVFVDGVFDDAGISKPTSS